MLKYVIADHPPLLETRAAVRIAKSSGLSICPLWDGQDEHHFSYLHIKPDSYGRGLSMATWRADLLCMNTQILLHVRCTDVSHL